MLELIGIALLAMLGISFGVGFLYLCLGRAIFCDLVREAVGNLAFSRFGVRHLFSWTATIAVLLGFLRTLTICESIASYIIAGVLFFPFALGIVHFFTLIVADSAELFVGRRRHRSFADSEEVGISTDDASGEGQGGEDGG